MLAAALAASVPAVRLPVTEAFEPALSAPVTPKVPDTVAGPLREVDPVTARPAALAVTAPPPREAAVAERLGVLTDAAVDFPEATTYDDVRIAILQRLKHVHCEQGQSIDDIVFQQAKLRTNEITARVCRQPDRRPTRFQRTKRYGAAAPAGE